MIAYDRNVDRNRFEVLFIIVEIIVMGVLLSEGNKGAQIKVRLFYLIVMLVPVGFPLNAWRNVSDLSPLKITISCRLFGI